MNWKKELVDKINSEEIKTDSDIEDFEDYHTLRHGEAFHYLAEYMAEGTPCEGCKYVDHRPDSWLCGSCSRNKVDYYEAKKL